jgi:hypothetical protein
MRSSSFPFYTFRFVLANDEVKQKRSIFFEKVLYNHLFVNDVCLWTVKSNVRDIGYRDAGANRCQDNQHL